jgi:zinc protease
MERKMPANHQIAKKLSVSIAAIAIACSVVPTAAKAQDAAVAVEAKSVETGWGIATNDLTPDPAVLYGMLPNGMKYAIRKNETPKGAGVVRLMINAGSAAEEENERGLAHLLEHMAFNGSKNIPEGELVKKLERLGLAFGADTNASTNFDATTYLLDLPKTDEETINAALFIMRETASELTIAPDAVNRERGVVLSERQTRNSPGIRQLENLLQTALPRTKLGFRLPAGTEEVLKTAPADRIAGFYRRFYRPENATLVMVGDFDVAAMEAKIKKQFSDWQGKGPAGTINIGTVDVQAPLTINQFNDPSSTVLVQFNNMAPYRQSENNFASALRDVLDSLGMAIMGQRLDSLGRVADTKVAGGFQQQADLFGTARQNTIGMLAKGDDWKSAVGASEQALRRALQFGFTQSELADILASTDAALQAAAAQQSAQTSSALAAGLLESSAKKGFLISPADSLALFQKAKPQITVDAVNAAFRTIWGKGPTAIHISAKAPIADFEASAKAALEDSAKIAVTAPEEAKEVRFAYDDFGKSGKISADKRIADLGIRTVRFANGVMLNIKKTDFEPGRILFNMRVGTGLKTLNNPPPGVSVLLNIMSQFDGLKAHNYDELKKITAGKTVSLGLNASPDSFGAAGATTPKDLELQLKLLAATVTSFGYRPETDAQWQAFAPVIATQLDATPGTVAQTQLPNLLASGDGRIGIGNIGEIAKRTMADAKAVISDQLATGAIEIALIGDVDEAAAIAMMAKTFGALPKRSATAAAVAAIRFPDDRTMRTLVHQGKDDQAVLSANWPTTDDSNLKVALGLELLAEVFSADLRDLVREKMGATYSPSVASSASNTFAGYGYMSANIVAEPEKMDAVLGAVKEITKSLRDEPITADALLRARQPMIELYEKQMRENDSWLGIVGVAQSEPRRLDRRRTRAAVLAAITPADLQSLAQQYLTDNALLEVRVVSKAVAAAKSK